MVIVVIVVIVVVVVVFLVFVVVVFAAVDLLVFHLMALQPALGELHRVLQTTRDGGQCAWVH